MPPVRSTPARSQAQGPDAPFGRAVLYFGCRRRDQDYLYGPLLEGWAAAGRLNLFTAFSREQARAAGGGAGVAGAPAGCAVLAGGRAGRPVAHLPAWLPGPGCLGLAGQ